MKKVLAIALAVCVVGALAACGNSSQTTTAAAETTVEETTAAETTAAEETEAPAAEQTVGGWTTVANAGVIYCTEDQQALFEKAKEGYTGLDMAPIAVVASQVVAGTNYAYLCQCSTVTAEPVDSYKIVIVYEDLEGNASINEVKDINLAAYTEAEAENAPEQLEGGWTANADDFEPTLNGGKEAFDKAMEGITGVGYKPYINMATQVVAGTNYAYFCQATLVTAEPEVYNAIVFVYEDLDGNASVTKIAPFDMANILE